MCFKNILNKVFWWSFNSVVGVYFLILIICVYFGPLKTALVKYNLKKNYTNVVASFTTTPYRVNQIKPVIETLLQQSIKPNKIYVNIPWEFKRDHKKYVIPDWLEKLDPRVIINRTEDYGPGTKLLATLEVVKDPNTIIVTVDDDGVYKKHTLRDVVENYASSSYKTKYKNGAVFTVGLNLLFAPNNALYMEPVLLNGSKSLIVIGSLGVAYKREFFKEDIFQFIRNLPLTCFLSDDLTISTYLLNKGIDIIKVSGTYSLFFMKSLKELPSSYADDALSYGAKGVATGSNEGNYSKCLDFWLTNGNASFRDLILTRSNLLHEALAEGGLEFAIFQLKCVLLELLFNGFPFAKKMFAAIVE